MAAKTKVNNVIDGLKAWDPQYSSNMLVRNLRTGIKEAITYHTKYEVLAVTALVGGPTIPGKLWDYLGDTTDQTREWVSLLTDLQVFMNWTKVERSRPAAVRDIAEKWTPAEKPVTRKRKSTTKGPGTKRTKYEDELDEEEAEERAHGMPEDVDNDAF